MSFGGCRVSNHVSVSRIQPREQFASRRQVAREVRLGFGTEMFDRKGKFDLARYPIGFVFTLSMILGSANSYAVEGGAGFYLLGQRSNQAAVLPPPGLFFQFDEYLYSGDTSASEVIAENGRLDLGVDADIALSLATGIWAPAAEILGGRPMLTLTLPFGYQEVSADAELSLGGVALKGRFSEDVFTVGDPVAAASLGWNRDNWHWTVSGALNIPIGDYDDDRSANFAFNRASGHSQLPTIGVFGMLRVKNIPTAAQFGYIVVNMKVIWEISD